jgi:2-phospho-L-lactate guanylyltransferase
MRTVIPFDARDPKRRLADVLTPAERDSFARAMLADVLAALDATDFEPTVIATEEPDFDVVADLRVDDRPLDPCVNDAIDAGTPVAVVMADLPLIGPEQLAALRETAGDVVLAPGRGAGTNAMLVRDPAFSVDYHGASFRDHRAIARDRGLSVGTVDSFRFATDIDERADLLEVLIHGRGRAADWLHDAGFRIETDDGRPVARRDDGG